ncbi:MAG: hypothetical protein ACRD2F_10020 [Terriglobales bacterium]
MPSPLEPFYLEAQRALAALGGQEPSSEAWLRAVLAKTLVLVAVSYFDAEVTAGLRAAFRRCLAKDMLLPLALNKAVEMQFHSLFNWRKPDFERFLGQFGGRFQNEIKRALWDSRAPEPGGPPRLDPFEAFISIGALRNQLAHLDFAAYPVDKTLDEVHEMAQRADLFLRIMLAELERCGPPAGGAPTS